MLQISPLRDNAREEFCKLFTDYYTELDCDENIPHLLEEYIIPDLIAGLIKIDILKNDGIYAGFIIYQTDDIDNDWNFREGWGDIREIYVIPSLRRQGFGKFLLYTAEMKLKENGTDKAYCLPDSKAEDFFTACGYVRTDEYSEELDCSVFEKLALNNCECKK